MSMRIKSLQVGLSIVYVYVCVWTRRVEKKSSRWKKNKFKGLQGLQVVNPD